MIAVGYFAPSYLLTSNNRLERSRVLNLIVRRRRMRMCRVQEIRRLATSLQV
jgi:hypothetical protein